jgi:hypothetical protein
MKTRAGEVCQELLRQHTGKAVYGRALLAEAVSNDE